MMRSSLRFGLLTILRQYKIRFAMNRYIPTIIVLLAASLSACSRYQAANIILSKDPKQAAKAAILNRDEIYKRNPLQLVQDIKSVRYNFKRLMDVLSGKAGEQWGKDDVLLPSRSRYVKYTHNYKSRAIINFDTGLVTIETLDDKDADTHLKNAIITTLLTPDDPRAVDLFSANTVKLSGRPFLYGLVLNQHGQSISDPDTAERFASYLLTQHRHQRIQHASRQQKVHYVELSMVSDHLDRRARRYASFVNHFSVRHGISKSLIYAVIKTESNFNPFAVSTAPAYGLMQLVPASGGRDAYAYVTGKDVIPGRQYLFDPGNNIELGTAYLAIISRDYLGRITHPVSKEYCTIAAYNTGSGNVLRTFARDRVQAVNIINSMQPQQVYQRLRQQLNSHEARRYLHKVVNARKLFVNS